MKLRYVLTVVAAAVAGFGASMALADDGHGHKGDRGKGDCKKAGVIGFASAPQSLTITVDRANGRSGLKNGQVVTVSVGSTGQRVRVLAVGCVGTDGTVTVREAELHAANPPKPRQKHDGGSTTSTTTESTSTSTSTTASTSTSTSTSL
jgi:hypothetical protein